MHIGFAIEKDHLTGRIIPLVCKYFLTSDRECSICIYLCRVFKIE